MIQRRGAAERLTLGIGLVLSVALGVVFYVNTDLSTAMATFAGLVGTTITLQVESLFRERKEQEEATRQQRLVGRIETIDWLPDLLDRALGALTTVEQSYGGTMAVDLARKAFDDCLTQLRDLQRGHYNTTDFDPSPNSPITALNERVKHSIFATSFAGDIDWWLGASFGRTEYWRLNEQALLRGVEIRRIFIYDAWTDALDALANFQHGRGVRVFRVAQDLIPDSLRLNLVIWDGVCCHQSLHNAVGDFVSQTFTFAAQDLARMLDHFKTIEAAAEPWPTPPAP
jgi:hypothetical protein